MKENLKEIYNLYVKDKFLYRAVSKEYLKDIGKHGLTPQNKPFDSFKKELRQFLSLLYSLDKRGYKIIYAWHHEIPPLAKLLRVLRKDIRRKRIDLAPNLKEIDYYIERRGGSLVTTILELSRFIEEKKYPLTNKESALIRRVVNWCKKRASYPMVMISIPRTSKYLETAHFQNFKEKYWASPFGSFEHFSKVINKFGFERYKPFLEGKLNFYLGLG
jgi:hypothetical protein